MKARHPSQRALATKVAISLPPDLFQALEWARRETGMGRSALIHQALEEFLTRRARAALVERYVESYRRDPEGPAEVEAARNAAAELLAREPWD